MANSDIWPFAAWVCTQSSSNAPSFHCCGRKPSPRRAWLLIKPF